AAAMLRGINLLFQLDLPHQLLAEMSMKLGSDVAFFLDERQGDLPRPAMVHGFGEKIERVGRVGAAVLLIFPHFGCPTADVYRALDASPSGVGADEGRVRGMIEQSVRAGRIDAKALSNDLAPAAFTV